MTQPDQSANADLVDAVPATRSGRRADAAPRTRKERREQERARSTVSRPTSSMQLSDGAAPIYRTRREMREAATRLARTLPVTRAEDAEIETDLVLPSFAFGASSVPTPEPAAQPIAVQAPVIEQAVVEQAVVEEVVLEQAPAVKAQPAIDVDEPAEQATPAAAVAADAPAATTESVRIDVTDTAPTPATDAELFSSIDDIVTSVLGTDAHADAEPTGPARRPLDTRIASRPVRARKAVAVRHADQHPPSAPRARRKAPGMLQRLTAGGAILFIGGLVAVTSLPAEAFTGGTAMPLPFGDAQSTTAQSVSVDEAAHGDESASFFLGTDDLTVNDAIASQTYSDSELAELQAVADGETIGDYYSSGTAMPEVWSMLETDYTQSPFPSLDEVPISSGFGYRWGSFHGGVDMIPGAGTPVFPVANGVVTAVFQGNHPGGGGYMVIVEHNIDGVWYQSWYPHLEAGSIDVEAGQVVDISTPLGAVGSTGNSTGAHLHLEIKNEDYTAIDPLIWLQTHEEVSEPTG